MAIVTGTDSDETLGNNSTGSLPDTTNSADTINALGGDDQVFAQGGNDVVNAGAGDDHVNAGDGNDTVHGDDGNDEINGQGDSDTLYGDAGNDELNGGTGNDTLIGGAGDDELSGAAGNDIFVFNFAFTQQQVQKTVYFRDGDAPSTNADYSAWNNYDKQLDAWRAEMAQLTGQADLDQQNTYSHDITVNGGSAKKPTTTTYHFDGDNSYSYNETVTTLQGEGQDVVYDFSGGDKLALNGLTASQALAMLTVTVVDGNTIISWGTSDKITLVGTTYADVAALVADTTHVMFG